MSDAPLKLFNSLTRSLEPFDPVHAGEARVYTCGPTVYNYPHIGNMRAYVFADILGRCERAGRLYPETQTTHLQVAGPHDHALQRQRCEDVFLADLESGHLCL